MADVPPTERSKAVVRALVEAVNSDLDRLAGSVSELLADNFVRHSTAAGPPGVRCRADLVGFLQAGRDTFPDAHETGQRHRARAARAPARDPRASQRPVPPEQG